MASSWPFVGRSAELTRACSLVRSGTGLLLLGEAGVGKSAFARATVELAADADTEVTSIVGRAVTSGVPFEAFANVLDARADGTVGATTAITAAEIGAALLAGLGDRRMLLLVDDVDLLDAGSVRVLVGLATSPRAVIIATARGTSLDEPLDGLWRGGFCERWELAGLSKDEVGDLLERVLEGPVDADAVATFARRSQGNPLVLRELTGAAITRGALSRRDGVWVLVGDPPLSGGVRELVAARLAGLDSDERAGLEIVAAGEPLPEEVAIVMVGESLLTDLEVQRLVRVDEGIGRFEVSVGHPLYGEVLRDAMPALRLHRLRLELASAFEESEQAASHDVVRAAIWRLDSGQADEPERLLAAARAARAISLPTAERLARRAYEQQPSLPATLLLAEILTHSGRSPEATVLVAALPPDSLTPHDREALTYCLALGQGLLVGDAGGGADLVAALTSGDRAASTQLQALHSSLLSFDGRVDEGAELGVPIIQDTTAPAATRMVAALGGVGGEFWLGHTRNAVALADMMAPLSDDPSVVEAVPYGPASMDLLAICALQDQGDLDRAEERARRMRTRALEAHDPFAGPRAEYCLGRIALARGQTRTAADRFRRCVATASPFDVFITRHLHSMVARSAAASADIVAATEALAAGHDLPRTKTYEPEWDFAAAAVLAAEVRLDEAADTAAWAAGLAADKHLWNLALAGYHDAARYGIARSVLAAMRAAAAHVDGTLAWCYVDHAAALAAHDPAALEQVAARFHSLGFALFAAEVASETALQFASAGDVRAARASAQRATEWWSQCEADAPPWLAGAPAAVPMTARERQVAALAAAGDSDAEIAAALGISARTVQTHLAHVYAKLGINRRADLAASLG